MKPDFFWTSRGLDYLCLAQSIHWTLIWLRRTHRPNCLKWQWSVSSKDERKNNTNLKSRIVFAAHNRLSLSNDIWSWLTNRNASLQQSSSSCVALQLNIWKRYVYLIYISSLWYVNIISDKPISPVGWSMDNGRFEEKLYNTFFLMVKNTLATNF